MARLRTIVALVRWLSSVAILAATVIIVWTVGPWLERRFYPVVSKLTLSEVVSRPDGSTQFMASFTKIRTCEYLGIGWYLEDPIRQRVPITLMRSAQDDNTPNRPIGFTRTGPWIVPLSPNQVENTSRAVLFHRCHPFWVSTTDFYP